MSTLCNRSLTEDQVREIRRLRSLSRGNNRTMCRILGLPYYSQEAIAKQFGVCRGTIEFLLAGYHYRWVK